MPRGSDPFGLNEFLDVCNSYDLTGSKMKLLEESL